MSDLSPKEARNEALEALAKLGGQLNADDDVLFEGKKFILPESVNLEQGVEFLKEKIREDEVEFAITRTFNYRPWDGARATGNAIKKAFGFSIGKPIRTMFGTNPPRLIDVKTSVDTSEQVPWGALTIPGLPGATLHLGATGHPEFGSIFSITVESPRKHRYAIEGLFLLIEQELEADSIYRGKAIDGQSMPEFLDLSGVNPHDVVYADEVMQQLEANVWSPIRHGDMLASLGQPGKRAVLLEGPYGSGKTLAAFLTAQVAVENGWTFVYCRPGKDNINDVMQTARLYQPSVLFFEDLDTLAVAGSDVDASKTLDLFDGIQSKGLKMSLVMTTNHVEKLHKGMMRPGRLDAVVHVGEMDRPGVERLARRVIGASLDQSTDFDLVAKAVYGFMPAFVREAFDRAVRYSVARNNGQLGLISTDDLILAAEGLRPQLSLMEGAADSVTVPSLDTAFRTMVTNVVNGTDVLDTDGDQYATLKK